MDQRPQEAAGGDGNVGGCRLGAKVVTVHDGINEHHL